MENVDLKLAFSVFNIAFLTELGDRTNLAALVLSADHPSQRWAVFGGAVAALLLATLIGVLAGGWVAHYLPQQTVRLASGVVFVILGLWTISKAFPL
ncbi:MAG: TMEM165/GDT1 family protein [Nevskiaceae bacterium]